MLRLISILLLSIALSACASKTTYSPGTSSQLTQGKRDFDNGYYKRSMRRLLPLACDGNAEAQYAVGYMYYYGFGVGQDSDVGGFWINRAAEQNYYPAKVAMTTVTKEKAQD